MLTQTIAEIRTYGEGFVIVDQSPSSVDIAAIKNTNTKIVLRTPEANDREAVGRSMGLTEDQVNEIAKLPSGVAVVYQNDWVSPVLTMIDKAPVIDDVPYVNSNPVKIRPLKEARSELVSVLMSPWIKHERIRKKVLLQDLKAIDLSSNHRKIIMKYINDYVFFCGKLVWDVEEIPKLQKSLMAILGITESDYERIIDSEMPDMLREAVIKKTKGFGAQEVDEICHVLTKVVK